MGFPTVASSISGNSGGNATSHSVNIGSPTNGQRVLVFFSNDGGDVTAAVTTPASGWNELYAINNNAAIHTGRHTAWYRDCDGTEGATITVTTSASEGSAYVRYTLDAGSFDPATPPAVATLEGSASSTNPDPPSLNPAAWDIEETLWFAVASWDGNVGHNTYPTVFTLYRLTDRWANNGGQGIAAAGDEDLDLATHDPGTFSITGSDQWSAATIAIRPASTGASSIAPGLIQQLGTVFAPNVREQLDPGLISQLASTFDPSVKLAVAPELVQNLGQVFAPTRIVTDDILPALIQQLGVTFSPEIEFQLSISIPLINRGIFDPSIFDPAIFDTGSGVIKPQLNQQVQIGLLQQLGITFAPTVIAGQPIDPPLITNLGVVFNPDLAHQLVLDVISNLGIVFDPRLSQQLSIGLISNPATIFDPSISQQLQMGLIQQLGTAFDPSLVQQIQLGMIVNLGQVFAPTSIFTDDILLSLIQQLGVVFAPVVTSGTPAQTLDPALIQQLGIVFDLSLAQQLQLSLTSSLGQVFDPSLAQQIQLGLVQQLGQTFDPSLAQQILIGLISQLGQTFTPTVIRTAEGQLDPQLIQQLGQVFSPSLAQQIRTTLIQQLGTIFNPTLLFNPRITPGLIAQLGTVHSPSILHQINLGLIPSTVLLFDPTVNITVEVPLVALAPLVFAPEISVAQSVVSPDLISQLGQVFDPELVGELLLLPTLIENLGVVFAPHILVGGQWVWIGQSGFGTTRDAGFPHMESGFGTTSRNEGDS